MATDQKSNPNNSEQQPSRKQRKMQKKKNGNQTDKEYNKPKPKPKPKPKKQFKKKKVDKKTFEALPGSIKGDNMIHTDKQLFQTFLEQAEEISYIPRHLLEKDYYLTLSLWALQQCGISIELKGGVSLSKGFGLTNRSAEDIDISIFAIDGLAGEIIQPLEEKDKADSALNKRYIFFKKLESILKENIPGTKVHLGDEGEVFFADDYYNGTFWIEYDSLYPEKFQEVKKNACYSCILLEVSSQPRHLNFQGLDEYSNQLVVKRDITSYLEYYSVPNEDIVWPIALDVECIHPVVTIFQKIMDCLHYRYFREVKKGDGEMKIMGNKTVVSFDARNVRHFEDCAEAIVAMKNGKINSMLTQLSCTIPSDSSWPYNYAYEIIDSPAELFQILSKRNVFRKSKKQKDSSIKLFKDPSLVFCKTSDTNHIVRWDRYSACFNERDVFHWGKRKNLSRYSNVICSWLEEMDI